MSEISIRTVQLHDEDELHEWWRVGRDSQDRAYDVYPAWEHSRVALVEESPEHDLVLLGAYEAGTMVGTGLVELHLLDNTHAAWVEIGVPPQHRRRGVGSSILAHIEELAREAGRTHLMGAAYTPPAGSSAGSLFAAASGYDVANTEGWKVLDLRDLPDWSPLDAQVAERIGDYRIVEWDTVTPEEHVTDIAAALTSFFSMVPTGELAIEDGEWTPERYLDNERRTAELSRRLVAAAIAPDGSLVGYTDVSVSRAQTTQASVGITFALPGHRGHSLGLAMKLANHRALVAALPECEIVRTSNAAVNEHMNAVNEAMGYRQVEDILEFQRVISS